MKSNTDTPGISFFYALLIFLFAAYMMVRVVNLSQAVQRVKTTADTRSYVRISQESVFESRFFASSRPFIFPLILKLFGKDPERVVWAQGMFSILSWSLLAAAVAYSLQLFILKLVGFSLILLLSLYRYILGWDSVLLTESLSLSLLALFVASWLWLVQGWRWEKAVSVFVVGFLWTFCRDTNAWVVFLVGLFLLLLVAARLIDKRYLFLSAGFLILFFLSNRSADFGERWIFPFQNVVGRRILPDAQAVDFFIECGMPVSPELAQLTGQFASGLERAFYEDPALEDYRAWLYGNGKTCYMKWLLSKPLQSIRAPITEFNSLMTLEDIQPFLFSSKFSPVLPARLESILYLRQQPWLVFLIACGVLLVVAFRRAWKQNKTWWVAIALILLVFPHYFIVWHGDVMGIFRHVLTVSVQFYLGLWLLALLVLDGIFSSRKVQEGLMSRFSAASLEG
jgi:hypothetical protein